MSNQVSSSVFSNAKWFMVVSVIQKLITFALNQIMVVNTSPEVLGQAAVQLELLLSTLLFLSREGIRMTVLRQPVGNLNSFQSIVNISWLPPIIVLIFMIILRWSREYFAPDYDFKVIYLYSGAALIECIGEPIYNMFQNAADIKPRLSAETSAIFAKSVVTVLCVAHWDFGVQGFGMAQLTYSTAYVSVLFYHYVLVINRKDCTFTGHALRLSNLLPGPLSEETQGGYRVFSVLFGPEMLNMAATLTGSSLLKHVLTEADKIALTLSASSYNQGIYAVTNNYGSLAARVIYLPLEDSSRLAFARLSSNYKEGVFAACSSQDNKSDTGKLTDQVESTEHVRRQFFEMKGTLVRLLRLVGFLGLFFAVFGIPYVPVAVQYVLGSKWRSAETESALSMYCIYLLVMGVNGVAESFVQTAAPASAFRVLNFGLVLSSLGFVAVAVPAVSYMGTSGIILANACSMLIRISNNAAYTLKMFSTPSLFFDANSASAFAKDGTLFRNVPHISKQELLREFTPPLVWTSTVLFSAAILHVSAFWYAGTVRSVKHTLVHVLVGALVAALYLLSSLFYAPEEDVSILMNRLPMFMQHRIKKSKPL